MGSPHSAESDALLAAVLAAPDDDAPRLVYADWLDENGQSDRATFIRLQIELARLPHYDPLRELLSRKAARLLDLYQADWLAELPSYKGITCGAFERGFVAAVEAQSYLQFARAADSLWTIAPIDTLELSGNMPQVRRAQTHSRLRTIRIRQINWAHRVDEFFDSPLLASIRTLDLSGLGLADDGLTFLAQSSSLENLRELILDENIVGIGGLQLLARSPIVDRLTRLSARAFGGGSDYLDPSVRSAGVEALAGSARFQHLETLDLAGNEIGDDALELLLQSPHLVNLRELSLANNELTEAAMEVLSDDSWEIRLARLDLTGNPIGDGGAASLAEADVLREVEDLQLERCAVGPRGAQALAAAEWFPALRALGLNDNWIGSEGASAVAATGTNLASLRLRGNGLGVSGARRLASSAALSQLLILDLSSNEIGGAALAAIAQSPHLNRLAILDVARNSLPARADRIEPAVSALAALAPQLVWLRLDENALWAPGILALVRGGEWSELVELGLRECGVNVPALAYLADHGRFPVLTRLALTANAIGPMGLRALLAAPLMRQLTHLDLTANRIGTEGARLIAEADLASLRWLSLEQNGIGTQGFAAIAGSTQLPRLKTLKSLGNNSRDWWPLIRQRFPGNESWGDDLTPEGEIPF